VETELAVIDRARVKRIEELEAHIRAIKVGAENQGAHTGMSWAQVVEICKIALGEE
jgi:hypothetical protein